MQPTGEDNPLTGGDSEYRKAGPAAHPSMAETALSAAAVVPDVQMVDGGYVVSGAQDVPGGALANFRRLGRMHARLLIRCAAAGWIPASVRHLKVLYEMARRELA